jgi:phenylalanyl-tRNA synthetase alpha subunit
MENTQNNQIEKSEESLKVNFNILQPSTSQHEEKSTDGLNNDESGSEHFEELKKLVEQNQALRKETRQMSKNCSIELNSIKKKIRNASNTEEIYENYLRSYHVKWIDFTSRIQFYTQYIENVNRNLRHMGYEIDFYESDSDDDDEYEDDSEYEEESDYGTDEEATEVEDEVDIENI